MKRGILVIIIIALLLVVSTIYLTRNKISFGPFTPTNPGSVEIKKSESRLSPQCSDRIDNDNDGETDFPSDAGCDNAQDNSEDSICNAPIWVKQGDPYFGEFPNKPRWVWLINNIQQNAQTQIISPTEFNGPLIGIGSSFTAENLGQDVLTPQLQNSENWFEDIQNARGWELPNNYKKFLFSHISNNNDLNSIDYSKIIQTRLDNFDTTNVLNVPQEFQSYLSPNAKVVKLETENTLGIPSIFLTWQLYLSTGYIPGYYYNYTDQDNWYGYYELIRNISANHDLTIDFMRYGKQNGEWFTEYVQTSTIPYRTEITFQGYKIYNYLNSERNRENPRWAIVYLYDENQQRSQITPTFTAYFQTVYNPEQGGENYRFVPIFTNYDTGNLEYALNRDQQTDIYLPQRYFFEHSYLDDRTNLDASTFSEGSRFTITAQHYLYWPDSGIDNENLLAKFNLDQDTGEVISLGDIPNFAEEREFSYYNYNYNTNTRLNTVNLGEKQGKYKTSVGYIVEEPRTNSQEEKVVFYAPARKDFAFEGFFGEDRTTHWSTYLTGLTELGRNIFTNNPDYPYWNWQGLPWNLDYRYPSNPPYYENQNYAGLSHGTTRFNGRDIAFHEALVSGLDSPRAQTSITSLDDSYQENVYIETGAAINSSGYQNSGIKYIYAFDSPINLANLDNYRTLTINFSGRDILTFSGYRRENNQDYLLVQRCRPAPPETPTRECETDADCADEFFCTTDTCVPTYNGGTRCTNSYVPNPCWNGDNRTCTIDYCNEETDSCEFDDSSCCLRDEDCPGYNSTNFCFAIGCAITPPETEGICTSEVTNCDDGVECTQDSCSVEEARCINEITLPCECREAGECPTGLCCRFNQYCDICD